MIVLTALYIAEQFYYKIPISHLDNVMNVDPITRQTFNNANQFSCKTNPQNVCALEPDQFFVLNPQSIKKTLLNYSKLNKTKLLFSQTPLLPKMQVYILKRT